MPFCCTALSLRGITLDLQEEGPVNLAQQAPSLTLFQTIRCASNAQAIPTPTLLLLRTRGLAISA